METYHSEEIITEEKEAGQSLTEEPREEKPGRKGHDGLRGFILGILLTVALFVIFVNVPFGQAVSRPDSLLTYKKLVQAKRTIDRHYTGEVDEQQLADYVFLGLIAGLGDKYAAYFTKEEYEEVSNTQQGHYSGIGITISARLEDDALVILSVTAGGPADRAGVLPGDIMLEINKTDLTGMTSSQAADLIHTSETDEIELKLYRESEDKTYTVTVVKEELDTISVAGKILDGDIGWIVISSFTGVTPGQFQEELDSMKEAGVKGLIVDLRGNPGGLVSSVCDTMRQILPEGVMVSEVDKYGTREDKTCSGENEIDIPMVVLVDEDTASAAEIFSGAVQDYGKGLIVGVQTYGKGIVQDVYTLFDGSVIRLTVSHYYTPNGNDIHEKGITPDVVIEDDPETEEDEQFEKALELLEGEN